MNGLTTKTTIDSPDLSGACATEHRRAVIAAIRNDAIEAARAVLTTGSSSAGAKALAILREADSHLQRLGATA